MRLAFLTLLAMLPVLAACGDDDGSVDRAGDGGASEAGASRLLMLDWSQRALVAAHPQTLKPIAGLDPLPMGHWATNYVSPDGRLMASVIGPTEQPQANLHVFDVDAWRELFVLDKPSDNLFPVAWAPDSRRVYLGKLSGNGQSLWVMDVDTGSSRLLRELRFTTHRVDVSPDGSTLYLFAFEAEDPETFMVSGDPFLVAVDSRTGDETARVPLPGMLLGQRHEQGGVYGEYYAMYHPAQAMSPDGRRYYVAHAEDDEITIVDLERMEVIKTAVPTLQKSIFERVLGALLGSGIAEAKGGPSSSRQLLVSPDGRRLFVTGANDDEPAPDGAGHQPAGLKVLEADSLEIIAEHEGVNTVALSPDGTLLFATGWSHTWTETGPNELTPDDFRGSGLKVIDARTGELVRDFEPGRIFENVRLSADGGFAYLMTYQGEYRGLDWKQEACSVPQVPCQTTTVYDVESGQALGEHVFATHAIDLVAAGPR